MYSENHTSSQGNVIDQCFKTQAQLGQLPDCTAPHPWYVYAHRHLPANEPLLIPPKAICRVAEPIALASCFPYAWVMVKDFRVGDRSSASFWAGIFISSFALAEALTGFAWGGVSDRIGRKPVLLIGCMGTLISLLIVGFSTNFWVALAGRALGGLLSEWGWYHVMCDH